MRTQPVVLAVAVLAAILGISPLGAQSPAGKVADSASLPDLSGLWQHRGAGGIARLYGKPLPFTEFGEQRFKAQDILKDPVGICLPAGPVRTANGSPHPFTIVQTKNMVAMLFEYQGTYRIIYTDGRKIPDDIEDYPEWMGFSVGHYEGDTLVVETAGINPRNWIDTKLEHSEKLRWRTTISNHRPEVLKKMAQSPTIQMGFSDAGAHLRNMAFYNSGLRFLRHAHEAEKSGTPFVSMEQAVHRLTGELGDWYGIDAGTLREGDRADIVVIDPERLDESLDRYAEHPVESYGGLSRMVNRNDDTVTAVLVSGKLAFGAGNAAPELGKERFGQFLRAGRPSRKLAATG